MKNKKLCFFLVIVILIVGGISFYFLNKQDEDSTLTILDKQWIESNKNKVIDLSIVNDVGILNYSGKGLIFEFLDDLEADTKLSFNKISYEYGQESKTKYSFKVVDKLSKNQISVYKDNYVLVTTNKVMYTKLSEINNLTIGVVDSKLDITNKYLNGANVTYKTYGDYEEMFDAISNNKINGIVVPRLAYLKNIISSNSYYISFNISEMTEHYVFELGDNNRLNQILSKYYKKWSKENFEDEFNKYFTNNYFSFSGIEEKDKVNFKSKRYTYGFVDNIPYDTTLVGKLLGINSNFIKQFSVLSGVEINYKRYNNVSELEKAFNENKIDFYFNNVESFKSDIDIYNTISSFDENIVIVSKINNNVIINSINSLLDNTVMTVKGTKIAEYLKKVNIKTKEYNNIDDLISSRDGNSIMVIDENTYNYYSKSSLDKYKIDYQFKLDGEYNYSARDIKNNKPFNNFFDFYLSFINQKEIVNSSFNELLNIGNKPLLIKLFIIGIASIVAILLVLLGLKTIKPKKKKQPKISKENKLRYIDMLTSLKNRNYLNDNIEKWDDSEVYPQSIVIIDLNNVAYINDNYGHAEGDEVIKDAANILIQNQLLNSDIIRTNGNEFLIYLVEYDEKEIVSYIRKLNKEFKNLKHGYGAAIGYSIITDAIKTIDDAINEATLDMRSNKEETNN